MAKQTNEIDIKMVVDNMARDTVYFLDEAMFSWKKPKKHVDRRNKLEKIRDWIKDKIYEWRHAIGEWIAGDYFDY